MKCEVIYLSSAPCAYYQFECSIYPECVSSYKRCDWKRDCLDGSDETDCGKVLLHVKKYDYGKTFFPE